MMPILLRMLIGLLAIAVICSPFVICAALYWLLGPFIATVAIIVMGVCLISFVLGNQLLEELHK